MEWKINDNHCWLCGNLNSNDNKLTDHHTLPRHWKPLNNIVVPICEKCHKRINAEDVAGMVSFAFKIEQELGRQVGLWGKLRMSLDKYTVSQQAIMEAFKVKEKEVEENK